jgi:hypothetical protein
MKLLTSSNDKCIKMWDLRKKNKKKSSKNEPLLITRSDYHSSGIFSTHEMNSNIVVGLKVCESVLLLHASFSLLRIVVLYTTNWNLTN